VSALVEAQRPRRKDAARNYDALIQAARELFAERGAEAPLEDVAKQAGVGIGTLYRNFPTRRELFESVYAAEVDALCRWAGEVADREPWEALSAWLHRFVGYAATKRALREAMDSESAVFLTCRISMFEAGRPLLERAQRAGVVRADLELDDLLRLVAGITATSFTDDAQRDRVLEIALDGIRPR